MSREEKEHNCEGPSYQAYRADKVGVGNDGRHARESIADLGCRRDRISVGDSLSFDIGEERKERSEMLVHLTGELIWVAGLVVQKARIGKDAPCSSRLVSVQPEGRDLAEERTTLPSSRLWMAKTCSCI